MSHLDGSSIRTFSFLANRLCLIFFAACLPGWTSYDGHCYRFISTPHSWVDAENHCLNLNSDLLSIDSDAENELGKSLTEQSLNGCVWIGLRFHKVVAQVNKKLQWSDGTSVNFTKWNAITPTPFRDVIPSSARDGNNHVCVSYAVQSNVWVNESCSKDCSFVCKRKGRSK